MQARRILSILLLCILPGIEAIAARDTVSVFFPFNQGTLPEDSRRQLDSAIYNKVIHEKYPVQIIGYADEVGGDQYNLLLSRERAASVKAYLIQSGFLAERIILITGKGEALAQEASGPDGNPADRRVDIVMDKTPAPVKPETIMMGRLSASSSTTMTPSPGASPAPTRNASTTDIRSVATGETLVLDKIYFYAGRHIVRRESNDALDALYRSLQANPKVRINIEGHVCCVPASEPDALDDDTFRKELSLNRARAIREYLIKRGIDPARLQYEGFGHRRPVISPERSEEEANQNRRVEIRIIE